MPDISLSMHLKSVRKSQGQTLAQVAEGSGATLSQISRLENFGAGSVRLFEAIAEHLDIEWTGLPKMDGPAWERIRPARLRKGWSQSKLASRAGLSLPTVGGLEKGRGRFTSLEKVLQVLAPTMRPASLHSRLWSLPASSENRFTPPDFLRLARRVMGRPFELDPAASLHDQVKSRRKYFKEDDGLQQPWDAETVWCNPPYRLTTQFLARAHRAFVDGEAKRIIMLVPPRLHTLAWQRMTPASDVFLLSERLVFWVADGPLTYASPTALAIVIFGADTECLARAKAAWPDAIHVRRRGRRLAALKLVAVRTSGRS